MIACNVASMFVKSRNCEYANKVLTISRDPRRTMWSVLEMRNSRVSFRSTVVPTLSACLSAPPRGVVEWEGVIHLLSLVPLERRTLGPASFLRSYGVHPDLMGLLGMGPVTKLLFPRFKSLSDKVFRLQIMVRSVSEKYQNTHFSLIN